MEVIKWTDEAQAFSDIALVILTGLGFFFINLQLRAARKARQIATYEDLYSRMHDIHKVFLEYPELRKYFYEGKHNKHEDAATIQRLQTIAEMMTDFFQQIHLQIESMPPSTAQGWKNYINTIVDNSPVSNTFLHKHQNWYPSNFVKRAEANAE